LTLQAPTASMVDIARYGGASYACMLLATVWRHSDPAGIRNKAKCRQSEGPRSRAPPRLEDRRTLRPDCDYRFVPDDMDAAACPMPDDPIHFARGCSLKLLHGQQDNDFEFFRRSMCRRQYRRRRRCRASRQGEIPG
jgi:hypothetical protein